MYELALCAGVGALSLGLQRQGIQTACYVERDPYRTRVLIQRIQDGQLDPAPIWDDVCTFDGRPWRGRVSLVSAGFPCQPYSLAGDRNGEDDHRDLWHQIIRIIREIRPRFIFLENVTGLLVPVGAGPAPVGRVLGDLAASGYDAEWQVLRACDFGAEHIRERVFILAYPSEERRQRILYSDPSHSLSAYPQPQRETLDDVWMRLARLEQSMGQSCVFGSDDGTPRRVDRLAACGEAIYVPIAEYLGYHLMRAAGGNL